MTEYLPGGRRRIDRVLNPAFVVGLAGCDLGELRERRADADQEETDLSYARRLLQGRLDLLRAEQLDRRSGAVRPQKARTDAELAQHLAVVLTDGPRSDRGLGRFVAVSPSRIGEHRREAERAVADVGIADPSSMTDVELEVAITHLMQLEQQVSRSRHQVQQVVDRLASEIAGRYMVQELNSLDEATLVTEG